ncbi:MAG: hypothetical protein J5I59_08035 [Saprospiraceae bacterium]|nr:hypothetical protein [Saprospiraceae bacterium]
MAKVYIDCAWEFSVGYASVYLTYQTEYNECDDPFSSFCQQEAEENFNFTVGGVLTEFDRCMKYNN